MRIFFEQADDLISIIKKILGHTTLINITRSTHGKSSYVYFVKTSNCDYLFKFPRTVFQAQNIEFEKIISDIIRKYLFCEIPNITIGSYKNKKFAFYRVIPGSNMSDVSLNDVEQEHICSQLSKIVASISNIKLNLPLKTKKDLILEFCQEFSYQPDFSIISDIIVDNSNLIHGDFHRSNILINESKNICGLLDFSTFCHGSIYFDIAHMCFSMNEPFNRKFIYACEKSLDTPLDLDKIQRTMQFLDIMINRHYLPFIKGESNV